MALNPIIVRYHLCNFVH